MSDTGQGEGWWQASDGKWYPPEQHPDYQAGLTQPMAAAEPPPTAAMPPVPPTAPPGAVPPPGPAGPPPGAPGAAGSNAKWIVAGVLAVAAIAIAAFLLTRDDGKKNNVAAVSSSSAPSSSSSSSTSSSSSSRSSSSSSSSRSSSSSSSADAASSAIQSRLLKAADISSDFTDETFSADDSSPTPCGQPNVSQQYPPVIDVGSQASSSANDLFFQEEVTTYNDATTAEKAFQAYEQSVNCTQPTLGSSSESGTFSAPKDVSSDYGVPEAFEIDFQASGVEGQVIVVHSGKTMVVFGFAGKTSADTSTLPSPQDIVKKGLARLSS